MPRRPHQSQNTAKCGNCLAPLEPLDMFCLERQLLWFSALLPMPLAQYLPCHSVRLDALLNVAYEMFTYFVLLHIGVLYVCTIYLNLGEGNFALLVSCMMQTLIYFWATILKLFFRHVKAHSLCELMDYLSREQRMRSAIGFTYVTMSECLAQSKKWSKVFVVCCFVGVSFWLMLPLINRDRSLPLPCWYPIDYKAPYVYQFVYFLQIFGQFQVASSFAISTSFFMMLAILISGQFDILNCSLKNIIATTYILFRTDEEELMKLRDLQQIDKKEANEYYCAVEHEICPQCLQGLVESSVARPSNFKNAFTLAFSDCIVQHRFILRTLAMTEELYNVVWFFKSLEATLLLCLVAFDLVKSTEGASLLHLLSIIQYTLLVLWEWLIICYSGEIVFVNSQRCGEALLRCPWYLHIREMRSEFLFFLINSRRKFTLTAGKFFILNLERFRGMVTTSFSFLTLLQKLDQKE